jgi:ubiquinone biosynthesis protein
MPRLAHQFLSQTNQAEQNIPLSSAIEKLIEAQQNQALWQKRLVIAIVILAVIEIALVASSFLMHSL